MSPTYFRVNPLSSSLSVKELLSQNKREILTLSECNGTPIYYPKFVNEH